MPRNVKQLDDKDVNRLWLDFTESSFDLGTFCRNRDVTQGSFRKTMRERYPDHWEATVAGKKKKTSSYKLGRSLEYAAKKLLLAADYYVVRSAQSKGLIDLVALRRDGNLFVQGKISGNISTSEAFELIALADKVDALPILVARPTGRGVRFYTLKRQAQNLIKEPYVLSLPPIVDPVFPYAMVVEEDPQG